MRVYTKNQLQEVVNKTKSRESLPGVKLASRATPFITRIHLPCDKEGLHKVTVLRGDMIFVHHHGAEPDYPNYYRGVVQDIILRGNVLVLVTKETIKYEGEKTLNLGVYEQYLDNAEGRKLWYVTKVKQSTLGGV